MLITLYKQRVDSWDFVGIKASNGRYGIHEYPAMLHYLLVRELLEKFGEGRNVFLDPFCGSGVSLCEAIRAGKKAIGIDINPLALLIAKVRSSNINIRRIPTKEIIKEASLSKPDVPQVKNLEYWFKPQVIEKLGKLRAVIRQYKDTDFYELLLVAFSQTVRSTSNNRKGEFKRYRIEEAKLKHYNPDVFTVFERTLIDYMQRLIEDPIQDGILETYKRDIREGLNIKEQVDIVITSPPYGDSKTTVAYEQFSSFSLEWLSGLNPFGDASMSELSKLSLGSKNNLVIEKDFSPTLSHVISKLAMVSENRVKEVYNFFVDMYIACTKIAEVLRKGAVVCFIVGNRNVGRITIPTDEIIKEIYEYIGLTHKGTFVRRIHNKRMPLLNSPSNKAGEKSSTMNYEYILVMEK